MAIKIIQTPGYKEASEISVISDGHLLVSLKGPMSVATAGAFILALENDCHGCMHGCMAAAYAIMGD